jgi:hypothetical protein
MPDRIEHPQQAQAQAARFPSRGAEDKERPPASLAARIAALGLP